MPRNDHTQEQRDIIATYDYGTFEVVRFNPKGFAQKRKNGAWGLGNVTPHLYRRQELLGADPQELVLVVEGEKDVESARSLGRVSTTNPMGAGKWRESYSKDLVGRHVVIIPDNDAPGQRHAQQVAASVHPHAASVRMLALPEGKDLSDWLDLGHNREELEALLATVPVWTPSPLSVNGHEQGSLAVHPDPSDISGKVSLKDVEETFAKWLEIKDRYAIRVVLAVVAAHPIGGDPVWLFLVAPPSGLKTELIRACSGLAGTHPLSSLTPRTFASGLKAERDPSLLARLSSEVLLLKDFTTVLTMHRDDRQAILSQLREIYDGSYLKEFGTGKTVDWNGRLGFVAGVTQAIDTHAGVTAVLGERFVQYRIGAPDRRKSALRALDQVGKEVVMRAELAGAVEDFISSLQRPATLLGPPSEFAPRIAALADLVTRARSGVMRDGYSRELEYVPEPEGPARLTKQLACLLSALGMVRSADTDEEDYYVVYKVGTDCIPRHRTLVLTALNTVTDYLTTAQVAEHIGYPTSSARRILEDLTALKVAAVRKIGPGHADEWALTDETKQLLEDAAPAWEPTESPRREVADHASEA